MLSTKGSVCENGVAEWDGSLRFEPCVRCAKLLLCVGTDMQRCQLSHWKACTYNGLVSCEGAKRMATALNRCFRALEIFLTVILHLAVKCIIQVALWML